MIRFSPEERARLVAEEQARVRAAQSTTTSAAAPAAPAPPHLPITWGQQLAFTAAAKSALARLGIVARGPTDAEIVQFAQGGLDAEAISDYYSFLPEFVAHNPGLPYGLSAEQYRQSVAGYGTAFRNILGRDIGAPPAPRNRAERDTSLVGYALTNQISAQDFSTGVERFRQERGGIPSAAEFAQLRARPTQPRQPASGFPESTAPPRERSAEARVVRPAV